MEGVQEEQDGEGGLPLLFWGGIKLSAIILSLLLDGGRLNWSISG